MKERNTTRTVVLNVVGLTARLIGDSTPHLRAFFERHPSAAVKPVLPAVTCSAQATYLTGLPPSQHGVVANGWYNRELAEHHFWKQSNHLVQGEKIWETLRRETPGFTCAKLFWWFNMYSSADYSITPRPMYPADGRKVFDVYSSPPSIRDQIKRDLGEFPFPTFWGPMAGIASSRWIADSAKWIEERHQPSLSLVYLPHLDYNLQRLGLDLPAVAPDLTAIDDIVGDLLTFFEGKGCQVILISEYGITSVDQPVYLNRVFRQHGWITVKDELGREILDLGASRACAIADHQAAHVYVNDPSILEQVGNVLRHTPGVERVLDKSALRAEGLDHERAGDFVVLADPRSWFSYYYWEDDAKAPDFARCVDIHRKPGFDPVELFFNPHLRAPKAKAAFRLLQKKLGFRMLMDLIPLDATLVKGSHGRLPEDQLDWPVLSGDFANLPKTVNSTDVFNYLLQACRK
jgi:predicted AlkP superfamily pyrophosphatase or phosphodiesterase